jgi:chromosome segregation ATPase
MEKCLKGETSCSTEVDSAVGEGRHYLNEMDAASSKAKAKLGRHTEERNEVQAERLTLKAQWANIEQEADKLEEVAHAAQARAAELRATARELLGKEAELLKREDMCWTNINIQEGRLNHLEECQQTLRSRLENIDQLEGPVSRSVALILSYTFPGKA